MLAVPAFVEFGFWLTWLIRHAYHAINNNIFEGGNAPLSYEVVMASLLTLSWLYACIRPLLIRQHVLTVPYDLFSLYISMLFALILDVGAYLFKEYVRGEHGLPNTPTRHSQAVAFLVHVFCLFVLLSVTLSLPVDVPPPGVDADEIGKSVTPEDYTPLWGWISFWWVYPLLKRVRLVQRNVHEYLLP